MEAGRCPEHACTVLGPKALSRRVQAQVNGRDQDLAKFGSLPWDFSLQYRVTRLLCQVQPPASSPTAAFVDIAWTRNSRVHEDFQKFNKRICF
jgi:hypothetical protein